MRFDNVMILAAIGNNGQLSLGGVPPFDAADFVPLFVDLINAQVQAYVPTFVVGSQKFLGIYRAHFQQERIPSAALVPWSQHTEATRLELARWLMANPNFRIFVVGGANAYLDFMPHAGNMMLRRLDYSGPADEFLPRPYEHGYAPRKRSNAETSRRSSDVES